VAASNDGGRSFATNLAVSTGSSNAKVIPATVSPGAFDYGDYTGIAFLNGMLHPVWADNSATLIGKPIGTGPSYQVVEEGVRLKVVATATNDNGVIISAASAPSAIVADPAVIATGGYQLQVMQGVDTGAQAVATFTDPAGAEANTADHYTATINWGDGSAASVGVISFDSTSSHFTVTGHHAYSSSGTFTITATINHEGVTSSAASSAVSLQPGKARLLRRTQALASTLPLIALERQPLPRA
jgi:hypothetical protein